MPDDSSSLVVMGECLDGALDPEGRQISLVPVRALNKRSPTLTDAAVGRRIRDYRVSVGMPLSELSGLVGVSQPQLYRYEAGLTRVAASRLIAIAGSLGVSVEALTGGADPIGETGPAGRAEVDLLLRAFSNIVRPERRSALLALARSMADIKVHAPA